jgi:4'-phosphopantetheinyl transferase
MPLPPPGEVHVWSVDLDAPDLGVLGGMLTADELLRAGAKQSEQGRRRAVATRAAVRALLASYLGRPPDELAFGAGPHGKPRLEPASPLRFNLSHSGPLALIAAANAREVGIDLEQVKPRHDLPGLARRMFAEAEREAIAAADPDDADRAFYRHWVAKEAFVKATGRGLGASLRSFEVLLEAPGGARLVHVAGDRDEAARWTLAAVPTAPGYEAAVVAEGSATVLRPKPFDPTA